MVDDGSISIPGVVLQGRIGRGASSTVYVGVQARFHRRVAVKVLNAADPENHAARLFINECLTLGRLSNHPGIVTVFDGDMTPDGRPYLIMEYLAGGSLADELTDRGTLPATEVLDIAIQLCGALHTAHQAGVVHGDVKPQNVLISRPGGVALADFGIARINDTTGDGTNLSRMSLLYTAPERLDGTAPTPSSDIFGLGSTMFQLLSGYAPYGDPTESPLTVLQRMAARERRTLDQQAVPHALAEITERCLDPEPTRRPLSAAALGQDLRDLQRARGELPSQMVVIEPGRGVADSSLPDMPAMPTAHAVVAARGEDHSTLESTLPPTPRRRRRVGLVLGGAVMTAALIAVAVWLVSSGPDDSSASDSGAGVSSDTTAAPSTTTGSSIAGPQPDVTLVVPGVDATDQVLMARLGDGFEILSILSPTVAIKVDPVPLVTSTPAMVRYQAFNPLDTVTCATHMSRPITVTGVWQRVGTWNGNVIVLRVYQLETEDFAREAYATFSLEQGASASECTGFGHGAVEPDHESISVVHRSPELAGRLRGITANSWLKQRNPLDPAAGLTEGGIAIEDDTVVLFAVLWGNGTVPDHDALSRVVVETVERLGA
jgi:serine/threonine protein kinase